MTFGRLNFGASHFTGEETDGKIRNLSVEQGAFFSVLADWENQFIEAGQNVRFLCLINGDLYSVLPPGTTSTQIDGAGTDHQSIEIRTIREKTRGLPDLHGDFLGKRIYVKWDRSTDSDCAKYNVYHDAGGGTVDYGTLVATVDEINVERLHKVEKTSGSGSGLISLEGEWTGATPVNVTGQIKIVGTGQFQWKTTGAFSSGVTFAEGSSYTFENAIRVTFHNAPADYTTNDTFDFAIGPDNFYTSAVLSEGSYEFGVKASDAAGNESSAIETGPVVHVIYPPGPPTTVTASYNSGSGEIDIAWTDPADGDLDRVLIMSNYSPVFGDLGDYIHEGAALAEVAGGVESYSISSPINGTWRFYVWTRDTSGRINKQVDRLEVALPQNPAGVSLNIPRNVTATPTAGGKILLKWLYDQRDGSSMSRFEIYENTSSSSPVFTTPAYTYSSPTAVSGYPVQLYQYETSVIPGVRYYTIRSSDGTNDSMNVDLTTGTPDATAPSFSGTLGGVAS